MYASGGRGQVLSCRESSPNNGYYFPNQMLAGARSWSPHLADRKRSLARVFNRAFEPMGFIHPSSCWLCPFPSQVQQLAMIVSRMITNLSGGFSHLPCRADHSRWTVSCSPWATSYGHVAIQWDPLLCLPVSAPQVKRRWRGARSTFHHGSLWIFMSEI